MRRLTALLALLLATLLTACGGGGCYEDEPDCEEPTKPTPGVDCAKEPEKCK
jgi:hypothetical protein